MRIGLSVWMASVLWVLIIVWVAYLEDSALPGQMLAKYGTPKVLPAIMDGFIWADLIVLPIVLGYIVENNWREWSRYDLFVMGFIATVATWLFHEHLIAPGKWPATLGGLGQHTWAGWVHIPFMSVALTVIGLHFFKPLGGWDFFRAIPEQEAAWVGVGLLIQIQLDLHIVMHYVQVHYNFSWYPDPAKTDPSQAGMAYFFGALIVVLTFATGGFMPGFLVGTFALMFLGTHAVLWSLL